MKLIKRILAGSLVTCSLLSCFAAEVHAEEEMHASENLIKIIKEMEGFAEKPYWDYAQWTAGYGTKVPLDELTTTTLYGMTETRADQLMREHVEELETYVKDFEQTNGMKLTQNQFDAMLSFSYNCGPGWMKDSTPQRMIIENASEEDIMYGFGLWSTAGGSTLPGLVRRRLCEANMFSNGIYSTKVPDNYYYVSFRPTVGKTPVLTQSFMSDEVDIKADGVSSKYPFAGWFTDATSGKKVTKLTPEMNKQIVFAHWDGYDPLNIEIPNYIDVMHLDPKKSVIVNGDGINMRDLPGLTTNKIDLAMKGDNLEIDMISDTDGIIWGHSNRGWIALSFTTYEGNTEAKSTFDKDQNNSSVYIPRNGIVKCEDLVNTRVDAGLNNKVYTQLPNDLPITIYEEKEVDGTIWGRTVCGWISLNFIDFDHEFPEWYDANCEASGASVTDDNNYASNDETNNNKRDTNQGWGFVRVNSWLNVRKSPDVYGEIVGRYYNNSKQYIIETKTIGGVKWGKTNDGWICLLYFDFSKDLQGDKKVDVPNGYLKVRSAPNTNEKVVNIAADGTSISIYDIDRSNTWGKTKEGNWVQLNYLC